MTLSSKIEAATIIATLKNWLNHDTCTRNKEGIATTDDTHIMSPPTWPSHGQIKEWIKTLESFTNVIVAQTDGDADRLFDNTSYKAAREWIDFPLGKHDLPYWLQVHTAPIKAALDMALQSTRKPPVDTIAVPREVLLGVRDAINGVMPQLDFDCPDMPDSDSIGWQGDKEIPVTFGQVRAFIKTLASLDAVLSEGE